MIESPLRASEAALGARFAEVAGAEVVRSYGDPREEYRAVRERVGIADRSDLAHLRMWGREPAKMLHGMITNDLLGAAPGRAVYAAMLSPKGRMIAELRATVRRAPGGAEVWIDLPREALAGTAEHLRRYVPPMFARWEDASERVGTVGVYGPGARELVGRVTGAPLPEMVEDDAVELPFGSETLLVIGTRYTGEEGYDLTAPATVLPAVWEALLSEGEESGVRPVGHAALETLRIEAGRPRYGSDLTEETIPTEAYESTGLMARAISFTKGCYTGQEVIVRIAHRGHVNRHLRGLRLGEAPAPTSGTLLLHPETGRKVGQVTSAASSPLLGETVALAFVRRELGPGDRVRVASDDGPVGEVVEVPFG
jgi:aminomethyltransferase